MKGETDKDLKVEILLNGEVTDEFTKLESKYKIDIKPKNEGKNVLAVQIYLKENETDTDYTLIGTAKMEFFVLDIKNSVNSFNADKAGNIKSVIKKLAESGFEVALPNGTDGVSDGVYKKLAEQLKDKPAYSENIEGLQQILSDINENLPKAFMNGAERGEELLGAVKSYADTYKIEKDSFISNLDDKTAALALGLVIKDRESDFSDYEEFAEKIPSACALAEYNITYAQSLPQIFEKYKSVCEINTRSIDKNYLSATLNKLKEKTVNKYSEIPKLITEAYNEVKKKGTGGGNGGGNSGSGVKSNAVFYKDSINAENIIGNIGDNTTIAVKCDITTNSDYVIIAAAYEGDVLKKAVVGEENSDTVSIGNISGCDEIYIYYWNNASGMIPLANADYITK